MILAYIDPSTGSLLTTSLISLGLTATFSLRGLFYRLLSWLPDKSNKVKGQKMGLSPDFSGKLVFYSEGRQYWAVFEPVLAELQRLGQSFVYLSSDAADPPLASDAGDGCEFHYIGKLQQATPFLNRLRASLVVMTTPQLGIFLLKRSAQVAHYAHLLHAPTDPHTYRLYAFDFFDSVLCSSPFQIEALRALEKKRSSTPKQLLATGCTYYDTINLDANQNPNQIGCADSSVVGTVLYAPTWGHLSSLALAKELLLHLLENGYAVIFRPHPQSYQSDAEALAEIQQAVQQAQNPQWQARWCLDQNPSARESFRRCSLLVCDLSGIVYDFAFLQRKPIFAFDVPWADGGYEAHFLETPLSSYQLLQRTGGRLITAGDIPQLATLLTEAQQQQKAQDAQEPGQALNLASLAGPAADCVEDFVFHFGQAGPVAAQQLLDILSPLRKVRYEPDVAFAPK